jgi:hypothetical protein
MTKWTLVLSDGSRHDAETNIAFIIKGGRKLLRGNMVCSQGALVSAAEDPAPMLVSPDGQSQAISVEIVDGVARVTGI